MHQNRAKQKTKAKGGGPQAKGPAQALKSPCSVEVKVVTVREGPSPHTVFDCPERIFDLWRSVIVRADWYSEDKEHLVSFNLDGRHKLKNFSLVSIGTLNECIAHPREIFRSAIAVAAKNIIVAHNHPSGDASPSKTDIHLTRRLYTAGNLLEIPLLDHVIAGRGKRYFSFRETSYWPPGEQGENKKPMNALPQMGKKGNRLKIPRLRVAKHSELSDAGAIFFKELYDKIRDRNYDDAVSVFAGLHELIRHHPGLRKEATALARLVSGDRQLNHSPASNRARTL